MIPKMVPYMAPISTPGPLPLPPSLGIGLHVTEGLIVLLTILDVVNDPVYTPCHGRFKYRESVIVVVLGRTLVKDGPLTTARYVISI